MNINAINSLNFSKQSFKGINDKFYKEITERRPLSENYQKYIRPAIKQEVVKTAQFYGKPVRIAQLEGEKLLINVGSITKLIDAGNSTPNRITSIIENLIRGNFIAEERGVNISNRFFKDNEPELATKIYRKSPRFE